MSGSGAPNYVPDQHATTTLNNVLPDHDYHGFKSGLRTGERHTTGTAAHSVRSGTIGVHAQGRATTASRQKPEPATVASRHLSRSR